MQDFIFNSHRQARRKRRSLLVKLILILILGFAGYWAYTQYIQTAVDEEAAPTASPQHNRLPLPPVQDTRPVGKQVPNHGPATPNAVKIPVVEPAITDKQPTVASAEPTKIPFLPAAETHQANPAPTLLSDTSTTAQSSQPLNWLVHTISKGESLASIFKKHQLSPRELHHICSVEPFGKELSRIRPGQTLKIATDEQGSIQQLVLIKDPISSIHFEAKNNASYTAWNETREVEKRYRSTSGIIESSLFNDGHKAGLDDALIMNLAGIFGWDIDFALEIKDGDQFHVYYEEIYLDGKKLKNGPILAAEFINNGHSYKAVRYTDAQGDTAYYDEQGNAKKRAFLRTPVKFTRISSKFTRKRWHPVLKRWRSHKGVDYAAPRGTPVKAAGNGKVAFKGKKGGYGNVIFLHHGSKYTTVYGHLSRFARGIKTGSTVKQGQIIAYVGSSGLATGPHLHYEFRVHGKHQNPLTIKLPKSIQLPKTELTRFKTLTQPLFAQLDQLRAKTMVASASN